MTITITKVSDKEIPEHWRVVIIEGDTETYHDSATSKINAYGLITKELMKGKS